MSEAMTSEPVEYQPTTSRSEKVCLSAWPCTLECWPPIHSNGECQDMSHNPRPRTLFLLLGEVCLINDYPMLPGDILDLQRVADVHYTPGLLAKQAAQHAGPLPIHRVVGMHSGGVIADVDQYQLQASTRLIHAPPCVSSRKVQLLRSQGSPRNSLASSRSVAIPDARGTRGQSWTF